MFESGIWIIPLALVGSLVGMVVLIRFFQKKTQQDLKSAQTVLRNFHTSLRQLQNASQRYSTEDREPFGSEMKALVLNIESLHHQINDLQGRYMDLRDRANRLMVDMWRVFVGAPAYLFRWLDIRREIGSWQAEIKGIQSVFAASQNILQVLGRRGWELAGQAREVTAKAQQLRQTIAGLRERGVRGDAFETAFEQEGRLQADLRRIPTFFLEGEEATVLEQAEKESVADVHELLVEGGPQVDRLLAQAQGWEKQINDAQDRVAAARRTLGETQALLPTLPPELVLGPFETRLKQLTTVADSLNSTLSRLEIENLPEIGQRADRTRTEAQEIGDELKRGRRQLVALGRILDELNAGLKALSAQFGELATSPVHPIAWGKSRDRLTDLSRQVSAIGVIKKPRLPEQVEKDLAASSELLSMQKELAVNCRKVAEQHAELLKLLESPDLKQGPEWFQAVEVLVAQAAAYAPENWSPRDSAGTLPSDLENLADRHERLVSGQASSPISEMDIGREVEQIRALIGMHQSLRDRADRIKIRWGELQEIEKDLRERFQAARNVLSQVDLLARSNEYLAGVASPELATFRTQLDQRGTDLGQRQQGQVEEKAKALNSLIAQIEQSANGWIDRLNQDIEGKKKILAGKLDALDQIATLDERAVDEARRVISQDLPSSIAGRSRLRAAFSLNEILPQLKPRSDTWQACVAALHAIEDLEKPLIDSYQDALQQYETAKGQLASAVSLLPGRRSWPPASLTLEAEVQELAKIEQQWQAIEGQPNRAITVVRQFGELSGKFQALAERIRQKVERAEQEQTRIRDLENELDEMARRWQALARENPGAAGEIRNLNTQINRELEDLKRQYRQGSISYSQALQSLGFICQNVQNEQITLDDGRVIGITDGNKNYRRRF